MKLKTRIQLSLRRMGWRVPYWLLDRATRDMRKLADTMKRSDIVLDLGAHIGNATTEFAHRAKHVHAFEPNPFNFAKLKSQTQAYPNVTLHNAAVSDRSETLSLYFEEPRPGKYYEGSTIMENKSNVSYTKEVPVDAIDISEFIAGLGMQIDVIKMDIEGAEYKVLERLLDSGQIVDIGRIFVECHVDRIPELAEAKARVLAKATQMGVLEKIDFDWQ